MNHPRSAVIGKKGKSVWARSIVYNGRMATKQKAAKGKTTKLNGIVKEFFPSGKVAAEVPYKNGVRKGAGKMFYESGKLYATETYDVTLNGPTVTYYDTGVVQAKLNYKDGLLDGLCQQFYPSGKLESEVTWKAGKRQGVCTVYTEAGAVEKKVSYKDDKPN